MAPVYDFYMRRIRPSEDSSTKADTVPSLQYLHPSFVHRALILSGATGGAFVLGVGGCEVSDLLYSPAFPTSWKTLLDTLCIAWGGTLGVFIGALGGRAGYSSLCFILETALQKRGSRTSHHSLERVVDSDKHRSGSCTIDNI